MYNVYGFFFIDVYICALTSLCMTHVGVFLCDDVNMLTSIIDVCRLKTCI